MSRGGTLQLATHQGGRAALRPDRPHQARDLLARFLSESAHAQCDLARALADFDSRDESALALRKGEVVAVLPKRDAYTEKVIERVVFRYALFSLSIVDRNPCVWAV